MALITENEGILPFGGLLPEFRVEDTSGVVWTGDQLRKSLKGAVRGLVVAISCNHCPYVKVYEERIVALAARTLPRGILWLAVNPNAANPNYPEDSIAKMRSRAKERNFPFPYAADPDQALALALGAACTPEFFLFNHEAKLVYTGRLDDAQEESEVKERHLENAIADLLADRPIRVRQSHPIGCSIKWK